MSKMSFIICVLCLCSVISIGKTLEIQPLEDATHKKDVGSPLKFPKKTDASTPILVGDDPKLSKLPPKIFPSKPLDKISADLPFVSGTDKNLTEINHSSEGDKINLTDEKSSEKIITTSLENATKKEILQETNDKAKVEQQTLEQEDMLHSKYKGGQDVDELLKPEKKASEKDEKKPVVAPKRDPKSEVSVSPTLDKNGPKLMNETKTKSGESMLESTSKMMAVSSSVLANTQPKENGIIEPAKTVASILLSAVALLCFGAIGFLVWKRIAMRRFGRDVLINEEDFDEVADMHTFDRAQIQIT